MPSKAGRKKDTSAGKRKASKESIYVLALDEAERLDFELASGVNGIDDEIALLRVKIKSILGEGAKDLDALIKATNALERLIRTRYKIGKEQRKGLKEAIGNVLRDVAVPLGIGIGAVLEK